MSFKDSEFECKCGCGLGRENFRPKSLDRLYNARKMANIPFVLLSAMRCPEHNKDIKGKENSAHLRGAFDIRVANSHDRFIILQSLILAGFTRIGVYKTFIHADDDPTLPKEMTWLD